MIRENIEKMRRGWSSKQLKWPDQAGAFHAGLLVVCVAFLTLATPQRPTASISAKVAWWIASISLGIAGLAIWRLRKVISRTDEIRLQLAAGARQSQQLRAELVEARGAAEDAKRAKKEFLNNISHEIRTPMNGLMGTLELALNTHLSPDQQSHLQMAKTSADWLFHGVNDLLDFSRIESGRFRLDTIDFDLRVSLLDSLAAFKSSAEKKGIDLTYRISPEIPQLLVGDPTRLRLAVRHIVENAIKFTEHGEIEIRLECEPSGERFTSLLLSVRDTGIGISPQHLDRIFEPFEQEDGSSTRKYGGMGLGTAITCELAKSMEGRMWATSQPGKGSTFYFRARLGLSSKNAIHKPYDASVLAGVRILIVDGRAVNRRTLSRALANWGMRPFPVSTGRAALSAMREGSAAGDTFALVLMDSEIPDMDSFALSEQIKRNAEWSATAILILASAGLRGDAARCQNLGIAAYLTKPILHSQLRDAIATVLRNRTSEEEKQPLITRHTLRENLKLRILLAEDNPVNQVVSARLLEQYGHTVTVVSDGEQAVAELDKNSFDVVLMDLQMPTLDGFGATAKIRQREQSADQHTPIIAVTANVVPGERERCLGIGMDGYVAKPIRIPELLDTISQLGSSLESSGQQEAVLPPLARHDEEVVSVFLADTPGKIAELRRGWEQNDADTVRRVAHYLKGSAMYLGERRMSGVCEDIWVSAASGDTAETGKLLVSLEEEVAVIEAGAHWRKGVDSREQ